MAPQKHWNKTLSQISKLLKKMETCGNTTRTRKTPDIPLLRDREQRLVARAPADADL